METIKDFVILYKKQGDYEKAEPLLIEAIEGRHLKLGDTHLHAMESLNDRIVIYKTWSKPEKAERLEAKLPQTGAARE